MKKALLIMAAALMALCVSCKKDDDKSDTGGGGNTGGGGGGSQTMELRLNKVSSNEVRYSEKSTDGGQTWNIIAVTSSTQSNEIYTWNNNLLSNVKRQVNVQYLQQDGNRYEECDYDFRYDNGKLSNVVITGEESYAYDSTPHAVSANVNVTYDGDNMSDLTYYYGNGDFDVYHLEYSNGKLSSVTFDQNEINYFWNGDNISEIIASGDYWGDTEHCKYTYDDKKNPFYGIDASFRRAISVMIGYGNIFVIGFSKNNCTKEDSSGGSEKKEVYADYTYNGENYPTQVEITTIVGKENEENERWRSRRVETVTYEYLD